MFKQDWMMRQIESFASLLARMFFNKETTEYEVSQEELNSETNLLYRQLFALINDGKINEAEDLLFDKIDPNNKRYLELAIDFYSNLNNLSDIFLENSDFTREEIDEGLKNVADIFGISMI